MIMTDLKFIIAKNLVKYRKNHKFTQGELAQQINYSDKAISKWERGESMPDLATLKMLADLYGINIERFFVEDDTLNVTATASSRFSAKAKWLIVALSIGLVWLIATILFVLLGMFAPGLSNIWLCFVYAVPVSAIVGIVFSTIWGRLWSTAIAVTVLIWTLPLSLYLTLGMSQLWLLFLICIPLQILVIMWFVFLRVRQSNSKPICISADVRDKSKDDN